MIVFVCSFFVMVDCETIRWRAKLSHSFFLSFSLSINYSLEKWYAITIHACHFRWNMLGKRYIYIYILACVLCICFYVFLSSFFLFSVYAFFLQFIYLFFEESNATICIRVVYTRILVFFFWVLFLFANGEHLGQIK